MATESLVPVPAGDGRLFLKHRLDNSTMLRLAPDGDERVRSRRVDRPRAAPDVRRARVPRRLPVRHERPHDAHLRGRRDRRGRWRSREPGDGFPMLVGDDLVVLTKESSLHVGLASPEGWKERGRIDLFGDVVWSPPGYADGAFFARGQK